MACNYCTGKCDSAVINPYFAGCGITACTLPRLLSNIWSWVEHYIASWCRNCTFVPTVALACHYCSGIPFACRIFAVICIWIATNIWPAWRLFVVNYCACRIKLFVLKCNSCVSTRESTACVCRETICIKLITLNCCRTYRVFISASHFVLNRVFNLCAVCIYIVYCKVTWGNTRRFVCKCYSVCLAAFNFTCCCACCINKIIVIKKCCIR